VSALGRSGRPSTERPSVAEILRRHAPQYVRQHASQAAPQVQNVLARLALCRTRALGGRLYHCHGCDHQINIYNSCGDRHCPQCGGAKRRDWLERAAEVILPGLNYFQVIFTLPDGLSSLTLGNRREVYSLLMRCAWQALDAELREEQGIQSAATLVLHTWNQRLEHHSHVHAVVPGGGLSLDGKRWLKTRHPTHRRRRKPYLANNIELGIRFRKLFVAGLLRLQSRGELKLIPALQTSAALESWLATVAPAGWNVFIEPPPSETAQPENVLKYLARYLSGGPISDRRLISYDGQLVRFWARSLEKPPAGERAEQVAEELPALEFTRRWSLHILPKDFVKVRHYGGFSNKHRADYLERCCQLLDIQPPKPATAETANQNETQSEPETAFPESQPPTLECPRCQRSMACVMASERPSWSVTMNSIHRPPWYQRQ